MIDSGHDETCQGFQNNYKSGRKKRTDIINEQRRIIAYLDDLDGKNY
jgi:hypothetical protein